MEIVPDYNRDGKINDEDRGEISAENPFRWWVNDDDDEGDASGTDIPGEGYADYLGYEVDGLQDLVDFFPLHIELPDYLLHADSGFKIYLKHKSQTHGGILGPVPSINVIWYPEAELDADPTTVNSVGGFIRNLDRARDIVGRPIHQLRTAGLKIPDDMLDAMREGKGVVLIEGKHTTSNPLTIEIHKDGSPIGGFEFPLRISNVEDMYRYIDLRGIPKKLDGSSAAGKPSSLPTKSTDPGDPYPDKLTNGKYFVFVHGFNVTELNARGWNAEIFKRMHQMGSRARFVGISWYGDPGKIPIAKISPKYHVAVFNAFQTGDALKEALSFVDGDITIAAHSLGNIVVSNGITTGGFSPNRYYMINAASPVEAYQLASVSASQQYAMTEKEWKPYAAMQRLHAARWYQLFDENDGRSELAWNNLFQEATDFFDIYSFYSTGEDVVQNPEVDSTGLLENEFELSRGAWANQEFAKGTDYLASEIQGDVQAGWGFAFRYWTGPGDRDYDPPNPWDAEIFTDARLREDPIFKGFVKSDLTNPLMGSSLAENRLVRYHVLAGGIPSLSYAAAANPVDGVRQNFNMQELFRTDDEWPSDGHEGRKSGNWLHSDVYDVALSYVYQMYDQMIETGNLDSK